MVTVATPPRGGVSGRPLWLAVSSRRAARIFLLIAWSLWFGLLTGFLEILNVVLKRALSKHPILLGRHTFWLTPFADALVFLALGVLFIPLVFFVRRRYLLPFTVFIFALLSAYSIVLFHSEIYNSAAALLCVGIGAQVTRWAAQRISRFDRFVVLTLPGMVTAALILAFLLPRWSRWKESHDIAGLPASSAEAPNILLIVWDTVRADRLITYGYRRNTTPNLSRLAEEGVLFEYAIAPSPWTLPSHASFFTGHWAEEFAPAFSQPLEPYYPTLAEALKARGYRTAGFVANQAYCSSAYGLERGFIRFEDFSDWKTEILLSCQIGRRMATSSRLNGLLSSRGYWGRKSAQEINRDFLRWLDSSSSDRPFFAFLNYFDAHQPYWAPAALQERFGYWPEDNKVVFEPILRLAAAKNLAELGPEDRQVIQNAYDASIAYLDQCLGHLLGELEKRGVSDNTLVVVTADHGEQFGEHGLMEHRNSLYRSVLRVPLVLRLPGRISRGMRVGNVVSLRDLAATLLDLSGREEPITLPGKSLRRFWENTGENSQQTEPVFAALRPPYFRPDKASHIDAVIDEHFWYVRYADGREELFFWRYDPTESVNLATNITMEPVLAWYRGLLWRHLQGETGLMLLASLD